MKLHALQRIIPIKYNFFFTKETNKNYINLLIPRKQFYLRIVQILIQSKLI